MICTNCFETDYITTKRDIKYNFNDSEIIIHNVECEICPTCNEIIYTQKQSLEFDKKRIAAEFKLVPAFKPFHLRLLRKVLNANLDEICDLLQIGKNTYGRWERGDIDITPSMNLLVYHLIERIPEAKVNLLDIHMNKEIASNKSLIITKGISLGEFIRKITATTKLLPETVSIKIGTELNYLDRIINNELIPEDIPVSVIGNIVALFKLSIADLISMLNNTLKIITLRNDVSFVHARKSGNSDVSITAQSKTVNKILELLKDEFVEEERTVSEDYIKKVIAYLDNKEMSEVQ